MEEDFKFFKAESKKDWYSTKDGGMSNEDLMLGCIMRIADAVEKMSVNYVSLQNDVTNYKRWYNQEIDSNKRMARQIAAYRGHIKRLKK